MTEHIVKPQHSFAAEAANSDTPAERLAELSWDKTLHHILVANPATPENILKDLAQHGDRTTQQAVAENPNTPLKTLLELIPMYPEAFLANPALPLYLLSQPDLLQMISWRAYKQLLRCENIPLAMLRFLQAGAHPSRLYSTKEILEAVESHVSIAGEVNGEAWEAAAEQDIQVYVHAFPQKRITGSLRITKILLLVPELFNEHPELLDCCDDQAKRALVLFNSSINSEMLATLARDNNKTIVEKVARHHRTPDAVLAALAEAHGPEIRTAVAQNTKASTSLLATLAQDVCMEVRCATAHNHKTSIDDLRVLALDGSELVRVAVAQQLHINKEMYNVLVNDFAASVRAALARNVHAPENILLQLTSDHEEQVRAAVARNPRLPATSFAILFTDQDPKVRSSLAGNPRLPIDLLTQLAGEASSDIRRQLASNPRTPLYVLQTFMQSHNKDVWQNIARNPHATAEMLEYLARSTADISIRQSVAAHKKTSVPTLIWLNTLKEKYLYWNSLAKNPHTPASLLQAMISDAYLMHKVAHHPAMQSNEAYRPFIEQQEIRTIGVSALSILLEIRVKLPSEALDYFAQWESWQARYLTVLNPGIENSLLEKLTHDGHRYVRAAARKQLAIRS